MSQEPCLILDGKIAPYHFVHKGWNIAIKGGHLHWQ